MRLLVISTLSIFAAGLLSADDDKKKPAPEMSEERRKGTERVAKCRKLFADGKEGEAVALGMKSVAVFVAPYPKTQSVAIGVITSH